MRRSVRPSPTARPGFTLVELLVAAALCVVIMAILATAFSVGMDTLSELKTVVGLSEQLRSAEDTLGRDLDAPHLEGPSGGVVRVSDPLVAGGAWDGTVVGSGRRGFFYVLQPSEAQPIGSPAPYVLEGTDGSAPSFRATDHALAFTVQLPGGTSQEVFTAPIGLPPLSGDRFAALRNQSIRDLDPSGTQFVSRWAEVAYFLRPSVLLTTSNDPAAPPLRVFTLHRRQRALAPSPVLVAVPTSPIPPWYTSTTTNVNAYLREQYPELSFQTVKAAAANVQVNTPESITNKDFRFGFVKDWHNTGWQSDDPSNPARVTFIPAGRAEVRPGSTGPVADTALVSTDKFGSDVLMNNVLSMQVQLMYDLPTSVGTTFQDLPPTSTVGTIPPNTAGAPREYDTFQDPAATATKPKPRVKAIRVVIRAYDTKNQVTRQITITRDL